MSDPCIHLAWDSEFFSRRMGQVVAHRLTPAEGRRVVEWGCENRIDCLYFLADSDDAETVRVAEAEGFHLVNIRVTLECPLGENASLTLGSVNGAIREARPADVPFLRAIAGAVHSDTRFYCDPGFPRELCHRLYATWIERSCEGFADQVFVAEAAGEPVGYIACHRRAGGVGQIGLIGVQPDWAGQGIGRGLVVRALRWFVQEGLSRASVATQARNCGGQRLYQRCGFLTRNVALWYHRWFLPADICERSGQ